MNKRILALVLTIAMLLSMFPGNVFAAETVTEHTEHTFEEVQPETEAPTEPTTEAPTEPTTEAPTEPTTEAPTETVKDEEFLVSGNLVGDQTTYDMRGDQSDILSLLKYDAVEGDMTYLTQTLGIRQTGTDNERLAQEHVAKELEKLGYDVSVQEFTLTQPSGTSRNVIAVKKATKTTDLTIYVSAHIDSHRKSPGANDNASGIVGMLTIARAFKDVKTNYNIVFASFGGEEYGRQGSAYYVNSLTENEKVGAIANYNLDMIATGVTGCDYMVMMTCDGEDNHAALAARNAAGALSYGEDQFKTVQCDASDHMSFHDVGIPAVNFYWTSNNTVFDENAIGYYHTDRDNMLLNFSRERMEQMVNAVALAIHHDATSDYAAVVGEGTAREYYTDMEQARAIAEESGASLTDLTIHRHHGVEFGIPLDNAGFSVLLTNNSSGSGYYYLTEDVYLTGTDLYTGQYANGKTVYLCLNGYTIHGENAYWGFYDSCFYIYDCAEDKGQIALRSLEDVQSYIHLVDAVLSVTETYLLANTIATLYLEGGKVIGQASGNNTNSIFFDI